MTPPRDESRARPRRISLSVRLTAAGYEVAGELRQLSSVGCRASFARGVLPGLENGDPVQLEFRGLLLLEPLRTEAVVRGRIEEQGHVQLRLEFSDPETLQRSVPYVLLVEFTRRDAPRVAIEEVIEVDLRAPAVAGSGILVELSTGGAGLSLDPQLAEQLSTGERLEVGFRLPEREGSFQLVAAVRALRPAGERVGCSIQFDEAATSDFAAQRDALERIVDRRLASAPPVPERGERG